MQSSQRNVVRDLSHKAHKVINFSLVFEYVDLCKVEKQSAYQSAVICVPGTIYAVNVSGRRPDVTFHTDQFQRILSLLCENFPGNIQAISLF